MVNGNIDKKKDASNETKDPCYFILYWLVKNRVLFGGILILLPYKHLT